MLLSGVARRVTMVEKSEVVPQLPVSCLAEYVTKGGRSPQSVLRPYKFRDDGEGRARIVFHPPVIAVIRKYYKLGRDPEVFESAAAKWQKRACETDKKGLRAKLNSNIVALNLFRRRYEHKDFKLMPIPRINCQIGQLIFTASPDLWVEVEGRHFLIKIGFGKKTRSYADIVLAVMRRAALTHGHRIPQHGAVYLNVLTGEEQIGRFSYKSVVQTLEAAAREIAETWPKVTQFDTVSILHATGTKSAAHVRGGHSPGA
jgi:hypothetical protein